MIVNRFKKKEVIMVANMPGSAEFKPEDYGVDTWKEYYEQHMGVKFEDNRLYFCQACKRLIYGKDLVGAHVVNIQDMDGQIYIAMILANKNDEKTQMLPFTIPVDELLPFDPAAKVKS